MTQHPIIGWRWRAHGSIYRCVRWVRNAGFDMLLEEKGKDEFKSRKVGDVINISEVAIGRTFHLIWNDKTYVAHQSGCNCRICEPNENLC